LVHKLTQARTEHAWWQPPLALQLHDTRHEQGRGGSEIGGKLELLMMASEAAVAAAVKMLLLF
jgi:hypothetical protein